MTNFTRFAVTGTVIVFIISIIGAFLGYLVRFVLARNLSVQDYGLFYSVFSFLAFFVFIKSFGLDRSIANFIPEFHYKKENDKIKSLIIYVAIIQFITNSIIIVGIYLLSNFLSINYFHTPKADTVLKLMAIAFFIDNFVFILKFSFQGFQKMALFASIDLVRMLLILVIILIGFKLNYGIFGPVTAYIVVPALLLIFYTPILIKKIFQDFFSSKLILNLKLFKGFISNGIYMMAGDIGWLVLGYTDIIMLTYFTNLTNVGLYNVALPTANMLTYFPRAAAGVLLPLSAELWARQAKIFLKAGIEMLYKYSIIVILPIVLIMFSFTEILLNVLFGKQYLPAALPMKILSIGMIFATLYIINASFLVGIGNPKLSSIIVYIGGTLNFISNLILIPIIGMTGAAITTSISYFVMTIIGISAIRKHIGISLPIGTWFKSVVAGLSFMLFIEILKKLLDMNIWIETTVVLFLSGSFYILCLFLLRVADIREVTDIYKRVFK